MDGGCIDGLAWWCLRCGCRWGEDEDLRWKALRLQAFIELFVQITIKIIEFLSAEVNKLVLTAGEKQGIFLTARSLISPSSLSKIGFMFCSILLTGWLTGVRRNFVALCEGGNWTALNKLENRCIVRSLQKKSLLRGESILTLNIRFQKSGRPNESKPFKEKEKPKQCLRPCERYVIIRIIVSQRKLTSYLQRER